MEIRIETPDKNAPGFLKRQKKALEFTRAISENKVTPEVLDSLVDFISDFVVEPNDRDEAKELLWNASENQLTDILSALNSSKGDVPLEK